MKQKLKLHIWLIKTSENKYALKRSRLETRDNMFPENWNGSTISESDLFIEKEIEIELPDNAEVVL